MENQLRCVMFNREEFLIEHQLDADVLFLLEGLYQYGVRVLNLDGKTTKEDMEEKLLQAGYRTEETLLIAAEDATLQNGREIGLATIAFVNQEKNGQTYSAADIVVEGFEEVDFYFLERIYQRKHGIPWRVIETERTYLREMAVEDVEALYEIYAQEGMTDFIEPLCEKRADEIVQQRREEIETELPRFVNTVEQELRSSRDVLNILKAYQHNAGHAMKRELEITIADMASGNEENALTRWESRIGSTMLSDVVRGLISVKRGDNGIMYFQMLSMTFKQLELQKLKLEAMKQPGKMRKYSFMLLGCFLLMYLGVLGYVVLEAFGDLF